MKRIFWGVLIFIMALSTFIGCSDNKSSIQNNSTIEKSSTELPELNGNYAYLRVKIITKDKEVKTMHVIVSSFGPLSGVNIGNVPVGSEGELDCSNLLMMGGIKEDAEWIVSYKDEKQSNLPLTIYSIENIDSFTERLKER